MTFSGSESDDFGILIKTPPPDLTLSTRFDLFSDLLPDSHLQLDDILTFQNTPSLPKPPISPDSSINPITLAPPLTQLTVHLPSSSSSSSSSSSPPELKKNEQLLQQTINDQKKINSPTLLQQPSKRKKVKISISKLLPTSSTEYHNNNNHKSDNNNNKSNNNTPHTLHYYKRNPKTRISRISIGPQKPTLTKYNLPNIRPTLTNTLLPTTHKYPSNVVDSQASLAAAVDDAFLLPVGPTNIDTRSRQFLLPYVSTTTISSSITPTTTTVTPPNENTSDQNLVSPALPAITPLAEEEIRTGKTPKIPCNRDSYAGDDPVLGSYRVLLEHMSAQLTSELYQNKREGNTNWKVPTTPMRFEKFSPLKNEIDPKSQQLTELTKKHRRSHRRHHHKSTTRKIDSPISIDTFFPQNTVGGGTITMANNNTNGTTTTNNNNNNNNGITPKPSKLRIRLENGQIIHHDISTSTTAAAAARMLSSMPLPQKRPLDFDLEDDGDLRELHNSLAQQHTFFSQVSGTSSVDFEQQQQQQQQQHQQQQQQQQQQRYQYGPPGPRMTSENVQFKPLSSFNYIGPELSSKLVWILHVHFDAIRRARMAPLDVFKRVNAAFVEYFGAMVNVLVERTWAFDYIYVILLEFTTRSSPNGLVAVASMCGLLCKMFDAKHSTSEVHAFEGRCFEQLVKLACGRGDLQQQPRKNGSFFRKRQANDVDEDDLEIYAYPARVTLTYLFSRVRVTQTMVDRLVRIREHDDYFFKPRKIPLRCFIILWLKLIIAQFPEDGSHDGDQDSHVQYPMHSNDILALDLTKKLVETSYREAEMIVALEHNTTARNLYYQVFPELNTRSSRYPFLNTFTLSQLLAILDTAPQGLLADVTQIVLQSLRRAAVNPQTPFRFDLEEVVDGETQASRLRRHFEQPAHCHKHCKDCRKYRRRYNYVVQQYHRQAEPVADESVHRRCRKTGRWLCWKNSNHGRGDDDDDYDNDDYNGDGEVRKRSQRESMTTFDSEETTVVCEAGKALAAAASAAAAAENRNGNEPGEDPSSGEASSVLTPMESPECTCPVRRGFGNGSGTFRRSGGSFCGSCEVDLRDSGTWQEEIDVLGQDEHLMLPCGSFQNGFDMFCGETEDCGNKLDKWINEDNEEMHLDNKEAAAAVETVDKYPGETTSGSPIEIQGLALGQLRVTNRSPGKSPEKSTTTTTRNEYEDPIDLGLQKQAEGNGDNNCVNNPLLPLATNRPPPLPPRRPKLSVQTHGLADPKTMLLLNEAAQLDCRSSLQNPQSFDTPVTAPRVSSMYLGQRPLPPMSDAKRRPWSEGSSSESSSAGNVLRRLVRRARQKMRVRRDGRWASSRTYELKRKLSARGARERSQRGREGAGRNYKHKRQHNRQYQGPVREWSAWQNRARWVDARQVAESVGPAATASMRMPGGREALRCGGSMRGGDLMAMVECAMEPAVVSGYPMQQLRAYRGVLLEGERDEGKKMRRYKRGKELEEDDCDDGYDYGSGEKEEKEEEEDYNERRPVRSTLQRRYGVTGPGEFVRKGKSKCGNLREVEDD
ncbi:uncharacterized protein SAPINGB_P003565 [Magnusiomyces paraingens]|uniref:Uncharacterized protein n=1 Tax=Magnusiomyces paraingens TaxID=2606893 RepID=A0A5E8BQW8_9ASCO|nr:uncharacterized protein SAPINGB_P003565 [Saprochaete ingens]VVT53421.1 unnamed protein product [Saprochaete ingens]